MRPAVVLRKFRSGLVLAWAEVRRLLVVTALRCSQPSLRLGRGVQVGRGVRFRIYGGGRVHVGDYAALGDFVLIHAEGGVVTIGRDAFVGQGTEVVAHGRVSIGADVLIASRCVIRDADHRFDDPDVPVRLQGHVVRPVEVGDDVWLGSHVVVTAGSTVGRGSVVGANAVVRGTIPDLSVAVGAPARVVRARGDRRVPALAPGASPRAGAD
jgi:acetyltransferase-like isoleucine patch superfamily enzyme